MAENTTQQEQNEPLLIDPSTVAEKVKAAELTPKPEKAVKQKTGPVGATYTWGTGRRKSSIARVRIRPGDGKLLINKRKVDDYFTQPRDRNAIVAPLKSLKAEKKFDVFVNVKGGGLAGQAGAIRLALARALEKFDPELRKKLKPAGFLTRDARVVERKKYGLAGARRAYQFSKR